MAFSVGIVGFRGYSGAEAIRILSAHPRFEPVLLEHRADAGDDAKVLKKSTVQRIGVSEAKGLDAVLLCTPPEVSMELAQRFLDDGSAVIDLSGAFRLQTADRYKTWYKEEHTAPHLFKQAVYGLPEYTREHVRGARLVSNPGCYPTAANLALRPLIAAGVVNREAGIVCDAKSGVSGAGRKASLKTSFCEVTENFSAYSILKHRHVPEVLQVSGLEEQEFSFTAQLIPIDRGILETSYLRLNAAMSAVDVMEIYRAQYEHEAFVRLYEPGHVPDLHGVRRTNFCDIGVVVDEASRRCVVVSAIDNLVKGAAGQAIQNLNLVLGIEETAGLL